MDLGKYGRFPSEALIGKRYNICYEIGKAGDLTPFVPVEDDQGTIEEQGLEEVASVTHDLQQPTNDSFFDTNTSQQLSHEEIMQLRDQKGKSVISDLIQNSSTFELKNSYSKVKYIQRKQRKFSRWMRVLPVSTRTLTGHFMAREPAKILDLRLDSLGQMLNIANVQCGGKYLVVDDTNGLLLGAVVERACVAAESQAGTQILTVHEEHQFQPNLLKFFNFSESQLLSIFDLHAADCVPASLARTQWTNTQTDPQKLELYADKIEARKCKFNQKQDRRMEGRALYDEKNFNSLLIAMDAEKYTSESLIRAWLPSLQSGGSAVIFSSSKEALNAAFYFALHSDSCTDVRLTESFLRPYQTAEGRLHPFMTCNGHGGYILSLIKTIPAQ